MRPLYLDYNATTPLLPEVLEAMLPFLEEDFGNPSSSHPYGKRAKAAVDEARQKVAALLNAGPDEIVFTSGGTEANNLALLGVTLGPRGVLTSAIEHPAVENVCRRLEAQGHPVVRAGVDGEGVVRVDSVARALETGRFGLVSVMHSNNETGALQPIAEISALARARGILTHSDAAQSLGKVPVDVRALSADLLSVAGHKLYAPKGIGALFVRRGVKLTPLMLGASQERGLRPGTENVPYIVALGEACARATPPATERLERLASRLFELLRQGIVGLELNGPVRQRLPNTLNVSAPGVLGREWLAATPEIAASTGSACHEGHDTPSSVLTAMGLSPERALGAVRLTVGRLTTEDEVDKAAAALVAGYARARRKS